MQRPGKKALGESGWSVPAKLDVYMWFGERRGTNYIDDKELRGYEMTKEMRNAAKVPPTVLYYPGQMSDDLHPLSSLVFFETFGL